MSAPAIVRSPREQWLARRRELVTASDVPAILGQDKRRGPLAVYLEKVGELEPEETEFMARGRDFEAAIARAYGRQTGRPVIVPDDPFEVSIHPDLPWLGATLDRRTTCDVEKVPLQIKMALGSAKEWQDEPPIAYLIQVQIEIACTRASWGALAALVGPGPLKVVDLERHDVFLSRAIPALEEFHDRMKTRRPPEADALPGTTAAINAMWADEDGETVDLDDEAARLIDEIEARRILLDSEAVQIAELKNRLRVRMGAATFGKLPDGSYLTLRTTKRKRFVVEESTFRTLRRWWPKVRNRRT